MVATKNFSPISIDKFKKNDSPTQLKTDMTVSFDPLKSVMDKLQSIPPPIPGLLADEETPE